MHLFLLLQSKKCISITKCLNGGHRLYNLKKYLRENNIEKNIKKKIKICYCRVSTKKQIKDSEKQIKLWIKKIHLINYLKFKNQ